MALLNYNAADSARLDAALRKRGARFFSGVVWASVAAHRACLGRSPRTVVMQTSLVDKCFEPRVPERNLVGDWLIGPLQYVPRMGQPYTLKDAHAAYLRLIESIGKMDGAVARACVARAYGFMGGAGICDVRQHRPARGGGIPDVASGTSSRARA